ncbi:MAG: serine--tRNA ligase [Clostridiaceae bacterium]|nr:serine--tRNA ligase [Clostridiaceae bacterium]
MLDLVYIRNNPKQVAEKLARRGFVVDFSEFLESDAKRRALMHETEELKAERNTKSAQIPLIKKQKGDIASLTELLRELSDQIRENDILIKQMNTEQQEFLASLPNIPADDIPAGGKENNEVVSVWGEPMTVNASMKNHVDLVESCGMIDYERGAKLSGSGFWIYRGVGAIMEWALLNYFISEHLKDGYEMILPPHILNYECGYVAGQFPKFEEDIFQLRGGGDKFQFILPTAETALTNIHVDEILKESELPKKYFAFTPCYRREAGSYRADERGMIRGHQFNKVEMFQYTRPEDSEQAFCELTKKASKLVEGLGLVHRVSRLAAGDCSAGMRKTYDIEIWIPSMQIYKEVSSVSNAGDYQARRGNMRYRQAETGKTEFCHTLNGSGLATSRVIPAIVEQCQRPDGSIRVPGVLAPWMYGIEVIHPLDPGNG